MTKQPENPQQPPAPAPVPAAGVGGLENLLGFAEQLGSAPNQQAALTELTGLAEKEAQTVAPGNPLVGDLVSAAPEAAPVIQQFLSGDRQAGGLLGEGETLLGDLFGGSRPAAPTPPPAPPKQG